MADATAVRERVTNLIAVMLLAAVVVSAVAWGWPDLRAGWIESAGARARLAGQP